MIARILFGAALSALLASGCGSDSDGEDPFVDDRPIELRGACDSSELVGEFRLEVIAADGSASSALSGKILDRVDPTDPRVLVTSEGDCQLFRRTNPLCDPGCSSGEVCSVDEQCVASARGLDVGAIRVGGLAADLEMAARPPGNDYFDTELAHPAVSGGEEVRLRTVADDDGSALMVDGRGSEPLVVTGGEWVITEGQALPITWEAPTASPVHTKIGMSLSIDQHGTSPVSLSCEFDDDGSAEVPAAVIDQLFAAGVSGFPNGLIERRTSDSQDYGAGCVELEVVHSQRQDSSVTGHTPCRSPSQCPDGQTCDLETNTCVDP